MSPPAPPKPPYKAPCNGCGRCCQEELCHVGETAFGDDMEAPCPALIHDAGRWWCGFMLTEKAGGHPPRIAHSLGAGVGCGMEDE